MEPLTKLHQELDGLWEPEIGHDEFVRKLVNNFTTHDYYGELDEAGNLKYFAAIDATSEDGFFWLFYVNKEYRHLSRNLIDSILTDLRTRGVKTLKFATSNTSLSYQRWVKKFGAEKLYVTYQLTL